MSPLIQVSDEVYKKLKEQTKSPQDTPSDVIASLLGINQGNQGKQNTVQEEAPVLEIFPEESKIDETLKLDPEDPEDLYFTTIIQGHFGNEKVTTWNELIDTAHVLAVARVETYDALKKMSEADIVMGSYNENGFRPLPSIGISIQGDSPNMAWKNALHIAKRLNVSVEILFEWERKFTAARPGSRGVLSWSS
jgi:predicted CopG family antitoxin